MTLRKQGPEDANFSSFFLVICALLAAGILVWQAFAASGVANPVAEGTQRTAAVLDIGVLVFREGLECVLVLAAITAGASRKQDSYWNAIGLGAVVGFIATLATWAGAVRILNDLSQSVSVLSLQAATGLLAVIVLLLVMNWFFHKFYWTGWITYHSKRKRELLEKTGPEGGLRPSFLWGMGLLGFASLYREGFEVVLFLQSYRLRFGSEIVLRGASIGILLSAAVAVLTFITHRRLPYRKMLVLTGILLGVVLIVMVGEQAQEMQLAHWISITRISPLVPVVPDWLGLWLSVFPTTETLLAQGFAALLVLGSYVVASRGMGAKQPSSRA